MCNVSEKVSFVRISGRKKRCVCVVLAFVLLSVLGALTASNSLLNGPVLRVAAQTAPAASHSTVNYDVPDTAFPAALSAVVTLTVNAVHVYVSVAVVACLAVLLLYILARRRTEGRPCVKTWTWTVTPPTGNSFTLTGETPTFVPDQIGVYQVSLVVIDSCGASSTNTTTTTVTVNKKPPVADAGPDHTDIHRGDTVTLDGSGSSGPDAADALTSRHATLRQRFSRWRHRRAPRQNERTEAAPQPSPILEGGPSVDGTASRADEPTEELPEQTLMAQQAVADNTPGEFERAEGSAQQVSTPYQELLRTSARDLGAATRARELFKQGKDRQAINALYSATVTSLSDAGRLSIASSMTHWEKYDIIQAAMPDVSPPLRTLTIAYERTTYAGISLTEDERIAAVEACKSIHQHVKSLEGRP